MSAQELFDEFGHGHLNRLPPHRNPGLEIVYLRHGHMVWKCEGQAEAVPPASVYFTLPWQEHGSVYEYEPGHEWFFFVLRLPRFTRGPNGQLRFPHELGLSPDVARELSTNLLNARFHSVPASPLIAEIFPVLVHELSAPGTYHDSRVAHLTSLILVELARALGQADQTRSRHSDSGRISRLLTEIQASPGDPWTLDAMSKCIGLKRTQLEVLVRHYTGDTPMRYLNRIRVQRARELLHSDDKSITDIALECGFSSSQYFANVFKQMTGVTAHHYRRHGPPEIELPRRAP